VFFTGEGLGLELYRHGYPSRLRFQATAAHRPAFGYRARAASVCSPKVWATTRAPVTLAPVSLRDDGTVQACGTHSDRYPPASAAWWIPTQIAVPAKQE
jgi:hypothetical protein